MSLTALAAAMLWMGPLPDGDILDDGILLASALQTIDDDQTSVQSQPAVPAVELPAPGVRAPDAPLDPTQPVPAAAEPDGVAPAPVPAQPDDSVVDEDILVVGRRRSSADPLEQANVESYKAVQAIDRLLIGPISDVYKKGLPKPARDGVHNFLDNVHEPIVFLNYLLQFKPGKALETLARFVINSTIGVAGVFDIAKRKPFHLPHRANSLADTLAYYGVKPGPYLFVPLIGPTSLRDLAGIVVDRSLVPMAVGKPFTSPEYTLTTDVLGSLDYRVASDERLTKLHTASDPYAATRDDYFRKRNAEVYRLHNAKWRARHGVSLSPAPVATPPTSGELPVDSTTDAPPPGLASPAASGLTP